ncbi:MAG TPA: acyltransferase [Vicinamibacterales bacterium]|nr:acyltransferase [Vicinamibacterales bacterium]
MRHALKGLVTALATLLVVPRIVAFHLAALAIGRDRALESATQSLSRVPGVRGQYLRRAFLPYAGVRCNPSATICFGTTLSKPGAVLEQNVYVGPGCHLGLVHLEQDVLLAAGVHVPSGAHMHGIDDPTIPIREQEGQPTMVRIGAGSWIGSAAVILADVGANSVIGAGSVVTKPIPANVIAAGVPARVVRERMPAGEGPRPLSAAG